MLSNRIATIALLALGLPACAGDGVKQPVDDDFSALDGVDEKADAFSSHMTIVGSLDYGQTSASVKYTSSPKYRAYKFSGKQGDKVDVWVHSTDGDAVVWVLDNKFKTLASNDDASDDDLDSHATVTLPASSSNTHYLVFRDYWMDKAHFTVALAPLAAVDLKACNKDSDCVRVSANCCGLNNDWDACTKGDETAYHASLMCPASQICPHYVVQDNNAVAECNVATHECQAVLPADVACGGYTVNPHSCPTGYVCAGDGLVYDKPGSCYTTCGGIAGIHCDVGFSCQDNPNDGCDPANGGADCGGICVADSN